jgi:hypothetical protein
MLLLGGGAGGLSSPGPCQQRSENLDLIREKPENPGLDPRNQETPVSRGDTAKYAGEGLPALPVHHGPFTDKT